MSRFYAEIQGNRGRASRQGSVSSGMWAHIRGWNLGVKIFCEANGDADIITVMATGGSNNPSELRTLAVIKHENGKTMLRVNEGWITLSDISLDMAAGYPV